MKNVYWMYPEWLRSLVDRLIKKRDTWVLQATKTVDGEYIFTYPPFIWNESLCGGTEECIDFHAAFKLGRAPVAGDTVELTVSCHELPNATTVLEWQEDDGFGGNWYLDARAVLPMWLCGVAQVLFGYAPSRLWVIVKTLGT
jgi:hypothetical protein